MDRGMSSQRLPRRERGFSLIELMIVLLVISILLAVGIPTYLSARDRAENRGAQIDLVHVYQQAMADFASQGEFVPLGGHQYYGNYLNSQHPGLTVVSERDSSLLDKPNEVMVRASPTALQLGADSVNGKCWYMFTVQSASSGWIPSVVASPGAYYGASPAYEGQYCTTYDMQGGTSSYEPTPTSGWRSSFALASAHL